MSREVSRPALTEADGGYSRRKRTRAVRGSQAQLGAGGNEGIAVRRELNGVDVTADAHPRRAEPAVGPDWQRDDAVARTRFEGRTGGHQRRG